MKEYAGGGGRSKRAKRRTYTDGMLSSDEETEHIEDGLDPEELYKHKEYPAYFVKEMKGEDVTVEHFQKTGFKNPIFIREMSGLNMKIPDTSFSISDVRNMVGGKRILEVMNTATQSNAEMTLKDWEEWWTAPDRDATKLNVISLEFSHTKLDKEVIAPRVVRQIDFVDNVWPRHLKDSQEDTTNDMSRMLYPKVQKYCLMSIAGCYTDFHVDLGGTSVWYHVLKGQKIFWLIPPTAQNLKAFEHWHIDGKQSRVFFGDLVEKCGRVELNPGNTFLIPSGWIHAVYTPKDSLVFGGNYLHPYAFERQLKIAQLEETLKVPHKYRFPFFTEMMWWVLDRYCYHLLGRHHMALEEKIVTRLIGTEEERKSFQENIGHPYLTPEEVRGLKSIVLYLHNLPANRKNPPATLKDPVSLIKDIRIIVEVHKNDPFSKSLTGKPILYWSGIKNEVAMFRNKSRPHGPAKPLPRVDVGGGELHLDIRTVCCFCGLDGWWADVSLTDVDRKTTSSQLRECLLCGSVAHPDCLPDIGIDGKMDTSGKGPNWWTCPHCILSPPAPSDPESESPSAPATDPAPAAPPRAPMSAADVKMEPVEEMDTSESPGETSRPNLSSRVQASLVKICQLSPSVREASLAYSNMSEARLASCVLMPVLQYLTSPELCLAGQVCSAWRDVAGRVREGRGLDLTGVTLTPNCLSVITRHSPSSLRLDRTNITQTELSWLLQRTAPSFLSLSHLDWQVTVSALPASPCSSLTTLSLHGVTSLTDAAMAELFRPRDSQKCSLSGLRSLSLSHTEVSDVSMRYLAQNLHSLTTLKLEGCVKLTEAGLVQLGDPTLPLCSNLQTLDISHCPLVKEISPLASCINLSYLNVAGAGLSDEKIHHFRSLDSKFKLFNNCVFSKL